MLGLTKHEIRSDLAAYEGLRCEGDRLSFTGGEAGSICINLRVKEPHQLVYLARLVAHLGYEETEFAGAYLWITTWGVWESQVEAIGFKTLEQFRRSFGENRALESAPGHYFRHNEFDESVCCLLQPMTVGWDACYFPLGSRDYFAAVSHDSFIDVECRTRKMHDQALEILTQHEWIRPLLRADG